MKTDDKLDVVNDYNELRQYFDDITRLVSDFIWDLDQDLVLRSVSPRLREVTGYLPHEWIGRRLENFGVFVNQDGSEEKINWRKPFRDKSYRVRDREGKDFTFLLSGIPYFHVADGSFQGVHGVARDITQVLNVEEKMRNSKEIAEKANQAKSDFLASMSHELRTPLNGILGFAQLLELGTKPPLSEGQKKHTRHIIASGHHLLVLIDQVLELSRIEAGKYSINIVDVQIAALMDECLSLIREMAKKGGSASKMIALVVMVLWCEQTPRA